MKKAVKNTVKWFFLILFTGYVSGISFFTHTHIINRVVYVHSHPYKKAETKQHAHTEKQLILLDYLYQTSLTTEIIPDTDVANPSHVIRVIFTPIRPIHHQTGCRDNTSPRAPPAA